MICQKAVVGNKFIQVKHEFYSLKKIFAYFLATLLRVYALCSKSGKLWR